MRVDGGITVEEIVFAQPDAGDGVPPENVVYLQTQDVPAEGLEPARTVVSFGSTYTDEALSVADGAGGEVAGFALFELETNANAESRFKMHEGEFWVNHISGFEHALIEKRKLARDVAFARVDELVNATLARCCGAPRAARLPSPPPLAGAPSALAVVPFFGGQPEWNHADAARAAGDSTAHALAGEHFTAVNSHSIAPRALSCTSCARSSARSSAPRAGCAA